LTPEAATREDGRMSKRRTAFAFALLFTLLPAMAGTVLAPGARLFLIKTAHFDIIFPEASRKSALHLAPLADAVYDEVAGKLEAPAACRIPVVITPDIGTFNGYTNPVPYMHIVLYDTASSLDWTSFDDNFRGLFLHELTHAVSLRIRAPWAEFLGGIFGSWVLPGLLNTPEFMVEGVTVSFESADGVTGRANDPLVRERVRQDILENRFKTPFEASALYDEYPGGSVYYEYGGLFNAYLQKRYGMEAYARLWRAMGDLVFSLSLDPYEVGFYRVFEKSYGLPFRKAWADFRNSLEIGGVLDPPEVLPLGGAGRGFATLSGPLAAGEGCLFWVDARSRRAMALELSSMRESILFDADYNCKISDASPDARMRAGEGGRGSGRLLVTRALALPDGRDRLETAEYDLASRRFVPGSGIAGMREARYFGKGVLGIVSNLHNTDLVLASSDGRKILLAGSERLMFASPAVLDEKRVALVVAIGGKRGIGILDVDSGSLSLIKPQAGDGELLAYVRGLSASNGELCFSCDPNDRLYRLGRLEGLESGGSPTIHLEAEDYSGGVFSPVAVDGAIYYAGRFSEGEKLCRYPDGEGRAGGRSISCSLEPFEPAVPASPATALDVQVEPYRPLAYANPFNMWFLYPDPSAIGRSLNPTALFYLRDPIDANIFILSVGYDSLHPFADLGLEWMASDLPVSFTTSVQDSLVYLSSGEPIRQSLASAEADFSLPVFPIPRKFIFGLGGQGLARSYGSEDNPYSWSYYGFGAAASAIVGYEGRLPGSAKGSTRGLDIVSYHDIDLGSAVYKAETHLTAALDEPSLRLDLWGAWATEPILRLDSTSPVFSADRRPAYVEYQSLEIGSRRLVLEGSLSLNLATEPMHADLLGLYFNRLLVDSGCRGAYVSGGGDAFLCSAFARLSLDLGAAIGAAAGGFRTFAEGYARLDGSELADALGLRLGLQIDAASGLSEGARLYRPTAPALTAELY
jgi:hypothetical protein